MAANEEAIPSPLSKEVVEEHTSLKETKVINGVTIRKVKRDYVAHLPVKDGTAQFIFTEVYRSKQAFEAVLTVQFIHATEGAQPSFKQRMDFNSASAVSSLCTQLNAAYGDKKAGFNWVLILNRVGNAMQTAINDERKPTKFKPTDEFQPNVYLVEHFLEHGSPTLIHGDGSTGKSYLTLYMAVCAALGREFLGKRTTYFKTLYLDHEATAAKLLNRMHRVANGLNIPFASIAEHIHWYKPEGSIASCQEVIARLVEDEGYGCIIVDAGASASGGSPMDEQAVIKLFTALDHIPCAKLIIHHEPKDPAGADDKAYYGTTFWRNAPRLAWRLKREAKTENKSIIRAIHHKANDDAESAPILYAMDFPATVLPAVEFGFVDEFEQSDETKILIYLSEGEADLAAIAAAVALPPTTTERHLMELLKGGKIERKRDGKKYIYYVGN